jgi:hypothetical protein
MSKEPGIILTLFKLIRNLVKLLYITQIYKGQCFPLYKKLIKSGNSKHSCTGYKYNKEDIRPI